MPASGRVSLKVYNMLGQEMATLYSGRLSGGSHRFTWDAEQAASGVYFFELRTGWEVIMEKVVLMK
jgi:flagellar hook assembly protein FlgD